MLWALSRPPARIGEEGVMPEFESWEMKLAWQEAWQVRGCPPDGVLRSADRSPERERHLAACPFCGEQLENEIAAMELTGLPARPAREDGVIAARPKRIGEIWGVRTALGGWGPMVRHYNPPLVLIVGLSRLLEGPPGVSPHHPVPLEDARASGEQPVQVIQVYHDPILAGPGDISLDGELFAEAWNAYALAERDLETFWGSADEAAMEGVRRAMEAGIPPLPEDVSPFLEAFRRLEVEVGAFFAMKSIEGMLTRIERSPSDLILTCFSEPGALDAHLKRVHPSVRLPEALHSVLERLAFARLPDHELPLAAASDESRMHLNRAAWTPEGIDLVPEGAELTVWRATEGGVTVGGRIEGPIRPNSELLCWWHCTGRPPVPAGEVDFSEDGGFFRARFEGLSQDELENGRPVLLLCDGAEAAREADAGREPC